MTHRCFVVVVVVVVVVGGGGGGGLFFSKGMISCSRTRTEHHTVDDVSLF